MPQVNHRNRYTQVKKILHGLTEKIVNVAEDNIERLSDTAYIDILDVSQQIYMLGNYFVNPQHCRTGITDGRDNIFRTYVRSMIKAVDKAKELERVPQAASGEALPQVSAQVLARQARRGPVAPTIEIPVGGGTEDFRQLRDSISLRNGRTHSQRDQTEANLVALINHLITQQQGVHGSTSVLFENQERIRRLTEHNRRLQTEVRNMMRRFRNILQNTRDDLIDVVEFTEDDNY